MTQDRELVVLGTSSRAPTRERNHNGYLLRWDGESVLFDPGEGTQRQLLLAGESAASVDRVCITHLHGDHCLGLPGVLLNRHLHGRTELLEVIAPAEDARLAEKLVELTGEAAETAWVRPGEPGELATAPPYRLVAEALDHTVPTLGYRVEEPDGRRMDPAALAELGIGGPDVQQLIDEGELRVGDRIVRLDEVSEPRRGQRVAVVMDTRWCDAAISLARGVDLLLIEATFLEEHAELADPYGHLTARQAAEVAVRAGAQRLVLTHFSQRYPDPERIRAEAAEVFPDVHVAADLERLPISRRAH